VAAVEQATTGTLSLHRGKFAAFVATTDASALILPQQETLQAQAQAGYCLVATPNAIFVCHRRFVLPTLPPSTEIHPPPLFIPRLS